MERARQTERVEEKSASDRVRAKKNSMKKRKSNGKGFFFLTDIARKIKSN